MQFLGSHGYRCRIACSYGVDFLLKPKALFGCLALGLLSILSAQEMAKSPKAAAPDDWSSKTFDIKYADPERLRQIFSDRSFVMEADRDLKILIVRGSPAFLKEVEDTVKRFDVPPPTPANIQISVYLLTIAAQAPAGTGIPPELAALSKQLNTAGSPALRLAASQILRIREGEPGEASDLAGTLDSSKLSRIKIQSASVIPSAKAGAISISGLSVWLNILPIAPQTANTSPKPDADITANIDIEQNQPVILSKAGSDKPVVVIVKAAVVP